MANGIETPEYTVIKTYPDFELRQYKPHLIAEVEVMATFEDAGSAAFGVLAAYIFGENQSESKMKMTAPVQQESREKIAMTAPVSQQSVADDPDEKKRYRVNFFMPSKYTMETLPRPNNPAVKIREVPARTLAVRRYRGSWSTKRYRKEEAALLEALKRESLKPVGMPIFNRYNSPFSLPVMRTNEVAIETQND
ncbi:SOUL family heme-binding protein [Biformimicrobium ophioploci]|uniref:SOUL family heme-binding protein n=1 Tax=Biformimicrobium ophioploci TaxID=3036711 RepID=UPI002556358C|nr:heme-binding protein [Microbulbifer sp. NKW57]